MMGNANNSFVTAKLESDEDERALCRIATQTFNFSDEGWEKFVPLVGRDNLRVARSGDQVVGGMAYYPIGQYFGGKSIRTMGVALVCIAPEFRGNSYAFKMLSTVMHQGRDEGYSLACLFPTTSRFYRRLGYEQAGSSFTHNCSLRDIRGCKSRLPMRRVEPLRDAQPILERLATLSASRNNGNLDRDPGMWGRLYREQGGKVFCYLVGDPGSEVGYVIYDQVRREGRMASVLQNDAQRVFRVFDMVALNGDAMESIWSFVAGHTTVSDVVEWIGPPADDRTLLLDEYAVSIGRARRWMLSVMDVRQALANRGYPKVNLELPFAVIDPLFEANSGEFTLRVHDGVAEIVEGVTSEPIEITSQFLAPLYSGFTRAGVLHRYGKLSCSNQAAIAKAELLFAGNDPWMSDSF